MSNFGARNSVDIQLLWEFQNLGFGNRAIVRERQRETQLATLEVFRVQDRVAAEVVTAHAQARRAANRMKLAEEEVQSAVETATKSLALVRQTRTIGNTPVLILRPQEVVQSIQALDQAYRDYYGAVADTNRAQFRLYRALGHPAQCVIREQREAAPPSSTVIVRPSPKVILSTPVIPDDRTIPAEPRPLP
jgi:hypothetical protein